MKKWLVALLGILILSIASMYLFIPGNLVVSNVRIIKGTTGGVFKSLSNDLYWKNKLEVHPADSSDQSNNSCSDHVFTLTNKLYNVLEINAATANETYLTKLILLHLNPDSVAIKWQTSREAGINPIERFVRYQRARHLKSCMSAKLNDIQTFLAQTKNIYGFDIQRTTLTDTVLVSTKTTTGSYPSTEEIYRLIRKLKEYVKAQGAAETNYPMLNIISNKDSSYSVMVAIATNRGLEGNAEISFKRLARYQNKILTTDVKGGPASIRSGFKAIEDYMSDHHLTPPVIPFELLITDRSKESDTSRWITKIYYPII